MAKHHIENRVHDNLQALNLPCENIFITPMPFNTVLWRIVVLDNEYYWEGMASLLDDTREIHFDRKDRGFWPLPDKPELLNGFLAFTNDFVSYRVEDNQLIVSDLRLGISDNLAFQFQFAEKTTTDQWHVKMPERVRNVALAPDFSRLFDRLLGKQTSKSGQEHCSMC